MRFFARYASIETLRDVLLRRGLLQKKKKRVCEYDEERLNGGGAVRMDYS